MMKRLFLGIGLAVCLFSGVWGQAARAAQAPADGDGFQIIRQFYAQRAYAHVWTDAGKFESRARAVPDALMSAKAHGLDPEAYGATRMKDMLGAAAPTDKEGWDKAELYWTYGIWRYASDLLGYPADVSTLASVMDGNIAENLAELAPDTPFYKALQARLVELEGKLEAPEGAKRMAFGGKKSFKPGMSHPDVVALRMAMLPFGAMALPVSATAAEANLYDETLAKAVGRFQQEYGLKSDGALGPVTLDILNRDPAFERRQVVANLQRLREPHRRLREDRRIEVSIARYWLTAYDGGHEALSMPVIVGKPKRQTISFRTEISGVRLNPAWHVPNTIKKEDFLPMLVRDPARLVRMHGVKIVHGGRNVDPVSMDWSKMSSRELSQVGFWRPAGDGNPLGRYRVIMENPYDIYLHDTNKPQLFEASMRAQSSGCVRVSRPEELANFILNQKPEWNPQKIKETVKAGRTTDIVIENKIPIYLDYMTAWFNDRGQVILGVDVYGLDKPRYDGLVKHTLTTQGNAQKILDRVTDILTPELQEARHRDLVLTQSTN